METVINYPWYLEILPRVIFQNNYHLLAKTVSYRCLKIEDGMISSNTVAIFRVKTYGPFSQEAEMRMPQPKIAA